MTLTNSSQSLYTSFKHKTATLVSTAVLTLLLAVPSVAVAQDTSSIDSICFNAGSLVYSVVDTSNEKKALANLQLVLFSAKEAKDNPHAATYNALISELTYYALNRKGAFTGDQLKQIVRIKCPSVYAKYK